jgi:hypothetical protein
MLDELEAAMVERLRVWEQKNKMLPDRIFVYRDGVSEVGSYCLDRYFRTSDFLA